MDNNDSRQPRALYELAICTLSNFGAMSDSFGCNEFRNKKLAMKYLILSAKGGEAAAKAIIIRMAKSFQYSLSEDEKRDAMTWLQEAATLGYAVAMEDLARENLREYQISIDTRASRTFNASEFPLPSPLDSSAASITDSLEECNRHEVEDLYIGDPSHRNTPLH